ncbi:MULTISPECIES: hypothetical protein [unclassified Microbacterium]|uniref:hypothetical protein n=1 Tax=unclassified Microbacterium TaxID=2609290 RepID=UPI000EAA3E56|nr:MULTISPECIES: hypothetical protein [unclassified Microbacterium]MBT2483104.1 hypothetical protein [Microbacterium sp. ISL-108]RKN66165.1 hypothetical protein D7252_00120 [Microbacterium sp. CGR2]
MSGAFAGLRWRVIRHGPHDERGFGLVAGLVAAAGVIAVAVLARTGVLDQSWLTVAVSLLGLTWLLGPILLPGAAPILNPEWFRTLPRPPARIAWEMSASEAISVGSVITTAALSSFVVVAIPHGAGVVAVAVVAASSQVFFLLWLGRCAAAVTARLLRSTGGTWVAAFQMSVLLALSFAGWVPLFAVILPNLGTGDTTIITPSTPGAVPDAIETTLQALPTGWGIAAVTAAATHASFIAVAVPIVGLIVGGLLLWAIWIGLTARTLRQPPARTRSNLSAGRFRRTHSAQSTGPVRAVVSREVKTWFRDPHRRLALGHAWITPVLMILLVAPTGWSWALPFIGVLAAAIAGMTAVNTYALDGTALWQLLTTPKAIRADVAGRQLAWMLLFAIPVIVVTILLSLVSQSPFWAVALGMTLAATGMACASAPLFSALMPAIGADARDRVAATHNAGNPAGGQWTVFTAVAAAAAVPAVLTQITGTGHSWIAHLSIGIAVGTSALLTLTPLTRARLQRSGPALLAAMASGDPTRLRNRAARKPSTETPTHNL